MNEKIMYKKGISLIVLVITILVMIILASAIILTLSNNNIIEKTRNAVTDYNAKMVEEKIEVYDVEYTSKNNDTLTEETKEKIKDVYEEKNIDSDKMFVYKDKKTGEQIVCYKYSQVTSTEKTKLSALGISYLIADINEDEDINQEDIAIVNDYINGITHDIPYQKMLAIADIDGWENIDSYDIGIINQMINGTKSYKEVMGERWW